VSLETTALRTSASQALAEWHAAWLRRLPKTAEGLWDWLMALDQVARFDLLAFCAGCSVKPLESAATLRQTVSLMPTSWPQRCRST
jgi:hypothetical protein